MKQFQKFSLNQKVLSIFTGIVLLNTFCLVLLYFMQGREVLVQNTTIKNKSFLSSVDNNNYPQSTNSYSSKSISKTNTNNDFLTYEVQIDQNKKSILVFLFSFITCCGFGYVVIKKHILLPINTILSSTKELSEGSIPELVEHKQGDELGQISDCINNITKNKIELSEFVKNIGDGKTEANYELLSKKDILGTSLISMRDKIKTISEEDAKRSWANEGVAIFSDILMEEYSLEVLSEKLLNGLVKYVKANQGALFIRKENNAKETVFEMYSCYAWDRKKYIDKQIRLNEGLIGQAAIEKETIFLTDVPNNYISISSGMGHANPTSVLIVPLKVNDVVHGVIEIASFKVFEKYEIEFIEKLGENIASTISNTKSNENTKRLLEDTKAMNENLQAQEEELRQNAEELNATQESLERAKEEMKMQIEKLQFEKIKNEGILEGCVDAVISFNDKGKIEFFNKSSEELWSTSKENAIGQNIKGFIDLEIENENNNKVAIQEGLQTRQRTSINFLQRK